MSSLYWPVLYPDMLMTSPFPRPCMQIFFLGRGISNLLALFSYVFWIPMPFHVLTIFFLFLKMKVAMLPAQNTQIELLVAAAFAVSCWLCRVMLPIDLPGSRLGWSWTLSLTCIVIYFELNFLYILVVLFIYSFSLISNQ